MNLPTKIANHTLRREQVIEYLVKKGYNRTEQMLRMESSNLDKDGRPIQERVEDLGNVKYAKGFKMISDWIEQNLDIYKVWPLTLQVIDLSNRFCSLS